MKRVAVIGMGLMGGSLGLALKARGFGGVVAGYARRAETREVALRMGAVDEIHDQPGGAVANADTVVFCVPILSIPDVVKAGRGGLQNRCLVTDVGSTKAELGTSIDALLGGTQAVFVGSHPIAGSEQQGLDAARADLYENAVVVITPSQASPPWAVRQVTEFWQSVGGVVRTMGAEEHDRIMARTSHLPHLVSALLARTVGRDDEEGSLADYCGAGFRDTSRIAEGSPTVWHDIIQSNRERIELELDAYGASLDQLKALIRSGDSGVLQRFLEDARAKRIALVQGRSFDERRGQE